MPVGMLGCNCTILVCPKSKEAVVVDPGGDAARILESVHALGGRVVKVIHTHAHFDHVSGTAEVREHTGAETLLHPGDQFLIEGYSAQPAMVGLPFDLGPGPEIDGELAADQTIRFGEEAALVLHTPGHTPGSTCFSLKTPEGMLLLSGDTLFNMGVGRTDFPGGDFDVLQASIREQLMALEGSTRVIPGHGPETTIDFERKNNPFLR